MSVAAHRHMSINLDNLAVGTMQPGDNAHQRQEVSKHIDLDAHESREDLKASERASLQALSCRAMDIPGVCILDFLFGLCFIYLW